MKKISFKNILLPVFLAGLLLTVPVLRAAGPVGLGEVAQNMMEPVGLMSDFVYSACLVIGGSFLFASIVKYFEHRRSPLMVPISTVVFLLIAGLLLIAMPFLSLIGDGAIRYSLFQ